MLTKDQIAADLACVKLGHNLVSIGPLSEDYGVGVIIRDARFTFLKEWIEQSKLADIINEFEEWWALHEIFHSFVKKALAKQGIIEGNNKIYIGKNVVNIELKDECCDETWYNDTFGSNHEFEYYYQVNHENFYTISTMMNMSIDYNKLLEDYLRYTDILILTIKKQMRKLMIVLKKEFYVYMYDTQYTIHSLAHVQNQLDQLYNNYKV